MKKAKPSLLSRVEPAESPVILLKALAGEIKPAPHAQNPRYRYRFFIPGNLDLELIDRVESVTSEEAIRNGSTTNERRRYPCRYLFRCSSSSGKQNRWTTWICRKNHCHCTSKLWWALPKYSAILLRYLYGKREPTIICGQINFSSKSYVLGHDPAHLWSNIGSCFIFSL